MFNVEFLLAMALFLQQQRAALFLLHGAENSRIESVYYSELCDCKQSMRVVIKAYLAYDNVLGQRGGVDGGWGFVIKKFCVPSFSQPSSKIGHHHHTQTFIYCLTNEKRPIKTLNRTTVVAPPAKIKQLTWEVRSTHPYRLVSKLEEESHHLYWWDSVKGIMAPSQVRHRQVTRGIPNCACHADTATKRGRYSALASDWNESSCCVCVVGSVGFLSTTLLALRVCVCVALAAAASE
jgi:hypothetical protein